MEKEFLLMKNYFFIGVIMFCEVNICMMENLVIEKLSKKELREAVSIYDDNHNLKTNYEKLEKEYDKIYNNPDYHNIVAKLDGKIVGLATVVVNHDIVEELHPFLTVWNLSVHNLY